MSDTKQRGHKAHLLPEQVEKLHDLILGGDSYRTIQSLTGHSLTTITQHSMKIRGRQPKVTRVLPTKTFRDRSYNSIEEIAQHNRDSGRRDLEKSPELLALKDLFGRRRNIFCQFRSPEFGVQGYEICAILPSGRIERLSGDREFESRAKAFKKARTLANRHDFFEAYDEADYA